MQNRSTLIAYARRRRTRFDIFLLCFTVPFLALLSLAVLFYESVTPFFILTAVLIILVFLFFRLLPSYRAPLKIRAVEGEIIKVHSQKFEVNVMKTHSYSLVRKPYSNYYKDSFTLTLFIKDASGKITPHTVSGASESLCRYYSVGDRVLQISGVRLPMVLEAKDKRPICPICGAIEPSDGHNCK